MTIMLLPKGQMLFLGGEGMSMEHAKRISEFMGAFLRGAQTAGALNGVKMIIDARVEPAIAINVPT